MAFSWTSFTSDFEMSTRSILGWSFLDAASPKFTDRYETAIYNERFCSSGFVHIISNIEMASTKSLAFVHRQMRTKIIDGTSHIHITTSTEFAERHKTIYSRVNLRLDRIDLIKHVAQVLNVPIATARQFLESGRSSIENIAFLGASNQQAKFTQEGDIG